MKTFYVSVQWSMTATIQVEASSVEEATEKAYDTEGLPPGQYLDDSFTVHEQETKALNE